jgi:hypothetical protein
MKHHKPQVASPKSQGLEMLCQKDMEFARCFNAILIQPNCEVAKGMNAF